MFKFDFFGCSLNYIFSILASRLRFCLWPSHIPGQSEPVQRSFRE